MFKTKSGKQIDLSSAPEIAAGGEGRILESPSNSKRVVKIYHQPRPESFAKHLELLALLPANFIKPQEIYGNYITISPKHSKNT